MTAGADHNLPSDMYQLKIPLPQNKEVRAPKAK